MLQDFHQREFDDYVVAFEHAYKTISYDDFSQAEKRSVMFRPAFRTMTQERGRRDKALLIPLKPPGFCS